MDLIHPNYPFIKLEIASNPYLCFTCKATSILFLAITKKHNDLST